MSAPRATLAGLAGRRHPRTAPRDSPAPSARRWPGRSIAWLIVVAIVGSAGAAEARPKRRPAKAAFQRGLAAYKKGNFAAASVALSKAFQLERDADTLFAWAQAERKLDHCDKALDLYETVLGFDLPARNREAVERSIAECRTLIAAQAPAVAPVVEAPPAPAPQPTPEVTPAPVAVVASRPAPSPPPSPAPPPVWYQDPTALALLGTGVLATGAGIGLLVSARSLDHDAHSATTIDDARSLGDQAKSRGNLGLAVTGAGSALVIGGVVWIVLHRHATERPAVTGWLGPLGDAGVAVTGAF